MPRRIHNIAIDPSGTVTQGVFFIGVTNLTVVWTTPSGTMSLLASVTLIANHGNNKQRKMRIDPFALFPSEYYQQ